MRKRAAKLGANGLVIGEFKDPSTASMVASKLIGVGGDRKAKALAIRLKPKNEEEEEEEDPEPDPTP